MKLNCKDCGSTIAQDDLNVRLAIAKCASCHSVFGFADMIPGAASGGGRGDFDRPRATVAMPKHIAVADLGGELVLTRRWFSAKLFFLVVFCLLWNGFLVLWYSIALASDADLFMVIFPVLHVAIGVGLSYYVLCGFVNHTRIRVGQGHLQIAHRPLPWPGKKDLQTRDLDQIYCSEKVTQTKNGTQVTYELNAILRDGEHLKLLTLEDREQVLFMEQRLEGFLGIRDRPVPGEVPR